MTSLNDGIALADLFQAERPRLRGVAVRMLGSTAEADDAVQEAWIRLSRSGAEDIDNLGGWLTTVVARVCLDLLRARARRAEEPTTGAGATGRPGRGGPQPGGPGPGAPEAAGADADGPEHQALMADAVGSALVVVLDTLGPAERIAFVLHDVFSVPFDEIGPIISRSPEAARQLASRARRRVQTGRDEPEADADRRRQVVDAFMAAAKEGRMEGLIELLHPGAVLRTDPVAAGMGAGAGADGADEVAGYFCGRARAARPALVDGLPGAAWAMKGQVQVAFGFTVEDGLITAIDVMAEPSRTGAPDVILLRRR